MLLQFFEVLLGALCCAVGAVAAVANIPTTTKNYAPWIFYSALYYVNVILSGGGRIECWFFSNFAAAKCARAFQAARTQLRNISTCAVSQSVILSEYSCRPTHTTELTQDEHFHAAWVRSLDYIYIYIRMHTRKTIATDDLPQLYKHTSMCDERHVCFA